MKEEDIRKRDVFNRYLELVAKDVSRYFDRATFKSAACPACGSKKHGFEFEKSGFDYVKCRACSTLFVDPRPPFASIKEFYSGSESTSFWVNDFFKPVAEARREKIFRPRAEFVGSLVGSSRDMVIGDIGAGFGIFLEEMKKIAPHNRYVAIEPSAEMADICASRSLDVVRSCLEEISGMEGRFDVLTAFELAEHLLDPDDFFAKSAALLKRGGRIVLTTLNGMGFDILLLWERSKSVTPPHHLNFFNPGSIKVLLERSGFCDIDVTTPGKLDWDIVEGMILNEGVSAGRFWDHLARAGTRSAKDLLQSWISANGLSSHMMVTARRS